MRKKRARSAKLFGYSLDPLFLLNQRGRLISAHPRSLDTAQASLRLDAGPKKDRHSFGRTATNLSEAADSQNRRSGGEPFPSDSRDHKVLPSNENRRRGSPVVARKGRLFRHWRPAG